MRLDLDDFVFLGPGSEWFWIMAQFAALAVTGLAILRQLRAQRSAAVFDQMSAWSRDFDGPRMTRHKLALMLAIQGRNPDSGLPRANDEVPDFFERVGYLISRGHVNVEDFWSDSRMLVAFYWGILAPYIEQERATSADPTVYRWFEWLELEFRRIDQRRLGRSRSFDPATRASAILDRIAVLRARMERERETWGPLSAADELAAPALTQAPDAIEIEGERREVDGPGASATTGATELESPSISTSTDR
jgi:hypothetical protein